MLKKTLFLALLAAFATGAAACKKKPPEKLPPGTLTETQKAELRKKAHDNYKKLVEKFPESPYAAQAQERMKALTPPKK